ncbi:MAG: hypothetical protein Q7U74_06185, partial [Saprospiraceae bacterium]|nr:hypothetical protein [Saprospiraceae bacterium]
MKRIFAMFAVLALVAGMAMAAPSMYGSNGLFRTISAQNAGPMNYGIGVNVYGWQFAADSSAAAPYKLTVRDIKILPSGYFSINDMLELSVGTGFWMPSANAKGGTMDTTINPSGLLNSRVGLKFSYKLSDNFVGGLYAGYDIATLADTFKSAGVDYKGGIDARLLGDLKLGDGCLNLNAGMYMEMDADSASGETYYPNMHIPFGLGFSYDMGMITPYAE